MSSSSKARLIPKEPIVVVGAGIAGLAAANQLQDRGFAVLVVDKARGVGGRMATRRIGPGVADHGAQFFTVRGPKFRQLVSGWLSRNVALEWSRGFADQGGTVRQDGHPRYRGASGMTDIPKDLSRPLTIRLGTSVVALRANPTLAWSVQLYGGETVTTPGVVLTPPLPQSLNLLMAGGVPLPAPVSQDLRAIGYDPCMALIAVLDRPSHIPAPGAIQFGKGPIAWAADNRIKGISTGSTTITVHAGPEFSRALWDQEEDQAAGRILEHMQTWLGSEPVEVQLHRWRYSQPTSLYPHRTVLLTRPAPLVLAGDAFAGPRVEGAAVSGLAAADELAKVLSPAWQA